MTDLEATAREAPPPYMIFILVFLFFVTGLLGFLICHLLKKSGYRCRTGDMDDDEEEEKKGAIADEEDEENQDTVEQILKCIIENEANMEAFKEMLGNQNVCVRHDPRLLRKESLGGVPSHHHTVHSGSDHTSCHLCAQSRSKKSRRQSRAHRTKQRSGEQTVFSVGRFRVTHTDKKLQGGPNALVISGDNLDQSQDNEEQKDVMVDRKEGGYNLMNMFKDVRPTPESSNGAPVNVGKRKKSVVIFGQRRSSDPAGVKLATLPGGTGRETGGVKFGIQQQPVVLEESLQASHLADNAVVRPEAGTETGSKTQTASGPTQSSPLLEAKTFGSAAKSPSSQTQMQAHDLSCLPEVGPNPELHASLTNKSSDRNTPVPAPTSLPIPCPVQEEKKQEVNSPGPLQTSTPIAPAPGSITGFTPILSAPQLEPCSSAGPPAAHTPPGPSSTPSPDLNPDLRASLASVSLGSSTPSSFLIKTPSSVSSLKTPTSPPVLTPSPKLPHSFKGTPSENTKSASLSPSPASTPSLKLSSVPVMPSQSPIPPLSLGKSPSPLPAYTPSPVLPSSPKLTTMPISQQTMSSSAVPPTHSLGSSPRLTVRSDSVASLKSSTEGHVATAPKSSTEMELEGTTTLKPDEKTGSVTVGILKKTNVMGDFKGAAPSDKLSEDRLSSLPPSPSTPVFPSSSLGSRISTVKASPNSQREFSVVTMVEEEKPSVSTESQTGETSELGTTGGQKEDPSTALVGLTVSQDKDDMVEMEDIQDCKVKQ
ncbi:RELT-like protein 2 [Myripristis murdjan]|uniref:RELT-like protein 2 n=1 Tax=Myripristis murdjan TaxID=586833 RepID=UPI001175CA97|nr:endochitinase A-like [Myripristis murdjan]